MKKTIYKTIVTVEVLSHDPDIHSTLADIADEMINGDYSGVVNIGTPKPLKGVRAARAIMKHGSSPEFFMMDVRGNDLNTDE